MFCSTTGICLQHFRVVHVGHEKKSHHVLYEKKHRIKSVMAKNNAEKSEKMLNYRFGVGKCFFKKNCVFL